MTRALHLAVLALLLAATSPALAGAGYNDDGSVVDKTINLQVAPFGFVTGDSTVTVTLALGGLATVGLGFDYMAPILPPTHQIGAGLDLLFWFKRSHTGWFLGPYAHIAYSARSPSTLPVTSMHVGGMFGWRWLWQSGFNIGVGGGLGYKFELASEPCPAGAICTMIGDGVGARVIAEVGWAF
jgi:hypothetical protein